MSNSPHIFGVRHLSPAAAWHLRRLLDRVRPKLVLLEGSDDADELIPHIVSPKSKLPIAILAYTADAPVRTFVYPLATYSPEYQALLWCQEHRVKARFMDLPASVFLGLMDRDDGTAALEPEKKEGEKKGEKEQEEGEEAAPVELKRAPESVYDQVARLAGEPDYETYWERHFEQLQAEDSYWNAARAYGEQLRGLEDFSTRQGAEGLVREAYMRRKIQMAMAEGLKPEQIVVVTGAFHATALGPELPAMTDEELAKLRRRDSRMTLMPYSFFKLSTQSGYGAGNHAPAYFEMVWNGFEAAEGSDRPTAGRARPALPTLFLTNVVRELRAAGTFRSTAEVIEGVRLAEAMAEMKNSLPTLRELQDAAVTCLGQGEPGLVRESLLRVEVGTAIGSLAKGVTQTSIQDDFYRELARLKLDRYKTTVKQELVLNLREKLTAKTDVAAFRDLQPNRMSK